jgi:NRPS condensation-like uncharacterized protein
MEKSQKLPLNGLEKFMLAHESDTVSYNSQIIIEFAGGLEFEKLKEAIAHAVRDIPWLRSKTTQTFFQFKREILDFKAINLSKCLIIKDYPLNQDEIDQFCKTKFDLKNGHNFTFLVSPLDNGLTQLIFNVHHTLCDAAGQFLLLEEFFRILNNEEVRAEAKLVNTFRYRDLIKYMGIKWFLGKLWENRKSLKKQRQYKMAGLIDHPEQTGRTVSSRTLRLNQNQKDFIKGICKQNKASTTEYITFLAFSAYDKTLKERGDFKTPIMAYLPKTLRPFLKIRYSFQNILSTVIIVAKREEVNQEKFLGKIKHIIQNHKMDQAGKFIFSSLLPCSLALPHKLQAFFKKLDSDSNSITSSMLVSAGKVPKSFTFPKQWSNVSLWARGTMLKSPGIGVIFTGTNDNETITLEFVKELTDLETILTLEKNILMSIEDNLEMPQINFSSSYALAEQKSSSEKVSQTL